jgi:hypothetical protein
MTIEEAIKEIEDSGKMLGMGDYVDLEALKVAVEVMKDYQRVVCANERLLRENKLAFEERDRMHKLLVEHEMLKVPTMNITITKEQADKLEFKFE